MSSSEDDVLFAWYLLRKRRNRKRKYGTHPFLKNNIHHSSFIISKELEQDDRKFKEYYRMNKNNFAELLQLVEAKLRKKDTNYKVAIKPDEKLLVTLRFLATGRSFRDLTYSFYRGETTIAQIIKETCKVLWNTLQPLFMPIPNEEAWKIISKDFYDICNLPNCLGSIDGKHIRVNKFPKTGSAYFNYKGYFSLVLMACADAHGMFTMIDVGDMGRNSDGSVFRSSNILKFIQSNNSGIPNDKQLENDMNGMAIPYFFLGDEAFPLTSFLMRPYPQKILNPKRRIFNYRLSRGRKSVECAFGMLTSKFRIFHKPIISKNVDTVINIVKAGCVLHNFIRMKEGVLGQANKFATEKQVPLLNCPADSYNPRTIAMRNREYLTEYFVTSAGSIPIQWKYA